MEAFDLGVFLADPSMDRIDRCRKADLYAILAHFEFQVQGALIKAKLKECVVDSVGKVHFLRELVQSSVHKY